MRFVRVLFALVFALAIVGPEVHACPVHSATPGHHQDSESHHQNAHCTCPQACCRSGVSLSLPATPVAWSVAAGPVITASDEVAAPFFLPSRDFVLPFALAPPQL